MAKLSVRTEPAAPVSATFAAKAPPRAQPSFTVGTAAPVKKRRRGFGKAINAKGAAVFTRQLATLVKAGMPILRSLEVLSRQEKRPAFKAVLDSIEQVESGPDSEYFKRELPVDVEGRAYPCLVYEINPQRVRGKQRIGHGDWILFHST